METAPTPETLSVSELEQTEKTGLTRRQFLKRAALAAAGGAVVLSSGELENLTISGVLRFLENPQRAEATFRNIANRLGNERENPAFRPMVEILQEGIKEYEEKTGRKTYFQRNPDYRDYSYYEEKINKAAKDWFAVLPYDPRDFINVFTLRKVTPAIKTAILEVDRDFYGFPSFMSEVGGGMRARFIKEYPDYADKSWDKRKLAEDKIGDKIKEYLTEAKSYVESKVEKNENRPVSASKVFSFFLDKNEGDISQSLDDTFRFLKFAARNDFENADYTGNKVDRAWSNVAWMRSHILDEYGSKNYSRETNGQLNLIGKPYHSWSLVSLLTYLPSEVVSVGNLFVQLVELPSQGVTKLHSDLVTVADLKKIESSLLSHQI